MAHDRNQGPCLPLKPQEKSLGGNLIVCNL